MQTCKKCRQPMVPTVDLNGDVASILRKFASEAELMRWNCPGCGAERGEPLRKGDIEQIKAYVRRQKRKWWQFWIR